MLSMVFVDTGSPADLGPCWAMGLMWSFRMFDCGSPDVAIGHALLSWDCHRFTAGSRGTCLVDNPRRAKLIEGDIESRFEGKLDCVVDLSIVRDGLARVQSA